MAWDTEMTLSDFYVYNFVTFFNTISMYLIHRSAKLIIVIELVNVRINNFVPGKFLVNKILLILEQLGTCRLVVVLQDKTYVYDLNSLAILDSIDTVPNLKGAIPSLYFCTYYYVSFGLEILRNELLKQEVDKMLKFLCLCFSYRDLCILP